MICLGYPPETGGTELAAAELVSALSSRGHAVNVITGAPSLARRDPAPDCEIQSNSAIVTRVPRYGSVAAGAWYVREVLKAARNLQPPDIVHAHMASGPAVAALMLARRWRIPAVVKPSSGGALGEGNLGSVRARPGGHLRVRVLRGGVDAWVAVSTGIEQQLRFTWKVPTQRIVRIPNPIDMARFARGPDARSPGPALASSTSPAAPRQGSGCPSQIMGCGWRTRTPRDCG